MDYAQQHDDYDQQLEVTWQIDVIDSVGDLVTMGGALCYHPNGYLVTALHLIKKLDDESEDDESEDDENEANENEDDESEDDESEDDENEDDKNFGKIIAKCRGRGRRMEDNNEFIYAQVIYKAPFFDLAILKLDSGERTFPYKDLTSKIKMSIGDELALYGHASFIPYSSIFGKVGCPYESCTNLRRQLGDLNTIIRNIDEDELYSRRENYSIPSFGTTTGVHTLDIYGGNNLSDLNHSLIDLNPNLPLIEMAPGASGGFSGCPVFGRHNNKLVGILIVGHTERSYIVPVDVVSYMVKLFKKDKGMSSTT